MRAGAPHTLAAILGLLASSWAPTALLPPTLPLASAGAAAATPPPGQWHHPANTTEAPVRGYDRPKHRYGAGHRGVDFLTPTGQIVAPADGVVSFVGVVVNRKVLTITHGGGYKSSFEPIDTDLIKGETVTAGALLGTAGEYTDDGAHCAGTCFHWGVRRDEDYINPLPLLGLFKPSVLLPLSHSRL